MSKIFHTVLAFALSLAVFLLPITAYAASSDWRFTHNDQDTVIIGEIISKDSVSIVIKPMYYVVSTYSMNPEIKEQLRPEIAVVRISDYYDSLCEGDHVIASLNKTEDYFSVKWGMYRIDSTNYKILKIYNIDSTYRQDYIESFINSGIEYNEQNHNYISELLNGDDFDDVRAIIYPVGVKVAGQDHDIFQVLSDIINVLIFPICCIAVLIILIIIHRRKRGKIETLPIE